MLHAISGRGNDKEKCHSAGGRATGMGFYVRVYERMEARAWSSRYCTCEACGHCTAPRKADLVSLNCYNAALKCIYDVDRDTRERERERKTQHSMFHVDSCLYGASVERPWYHGICESDVVRIKRIKIQASARNVQIHRGLYLSACFSTREYKNRSLRLCFIRHGTGMRIETIKTRGSSPMHDSGVSKGFCWGERSTHISRCQGRVKYESAHSGCQTN